MLRAPLWGFPHSLRTRLIIQTYRYPECEVTAVHARELAVDLDELHQELHTQIADAQRHYQGLADTRWTPALEFKVGARVYIKVKYFHMTRPSQKLSKKFLGPFKIIRKAGLHSFILRLPVFHISMLVLGLVPSHK